MKRHTESGWCGVGDRTKPKEEDKRREANSNGGAAFIPPIPSGEVMRFDVTLPHS
jgi:hypothetical protein